MRKRTVRAIALVVVVATVALVSNVAAYRAATTPRRADVPCPTADASHANDGHRSPAVETCRDTTAQSKARSTDEDRDGSDERNEGGRRGGGSSSHVVVVTASGAS